MRDNDLFKIIIAEVLINLSDQNLSDVKVKRSYQPTQQSACEDRLIFINKVTNPQVGTGLKYSENNRIQQYLKRASFQFNALAQQDPSDINSLTASDILNITADTLQSYSSIRRLRDQGVNIEKITDIRSVYFTNDKDRHESVPSFDFIVNYKHEYVEEVSEITGNNINNYGV